MRRGSGLIVWLLLALVSLFFQFSFMEQLEWRWYDFAMRHAVSVPADPDLALVNIDAASITPSRPWPYRPDIYSRFLDRVERGKPRIVYMDVVFQAAPQISEKDYRVLLRKMREYGNVLLGLDLSKNGNVEPPPADLEKSALGFGVPYAEEDTDERVRRVYLLGRYPSGTVPSVPLLIAGAYKGYLGDARPVFNRKTRQFDWWLPAKKKLASSLPFTTEIPMYNPATTGPVVRWRDLEIPTATNRPDMFIFYEKAVTGKAISFWRVMDGSVNPGIFRGKILMLYNSTEIADAYYTPLSRGFLPGEKMPGGEVMAEAVNTLLTRSFIRHPAGFQIAAALGCLMTFFFFLSPLGSQKGLLMYLPILALYFSVSYFLFTRFRVWIGYTNLALSSVILYSGSLIAERLRVSRMMGLLIPEKMARALERTGLRIGGEEVSGTVMFVDMQGYTSRAESVPLQETFDMLRAFHENVERVVEPCGGIICDWQGDGVLIFFSDDSRTPSPVPRPAKNAVDAAIKMKEMFHENRTGVGIGIASGKVMWGFVGTAAKAQPSCIGDPVNLASRLQGVGKRFGSVIAADQATFDAARHDFPWLEQGPQQVRGKKDPVPVYTPGARESKDKL